jgi:hypothetical protein
MVHQLLYSAPGNTGLFELGPQRSERCIYVPRLSRSLVKVMIVGYVVDGYVGL